MLFAFKTLTDGSLTHPVNRARVAVVNQARAVAESRARVVDHHLLREIGVDGVRYFSLITLTIPPHKRMYVLTKYHHHPIIYVQSS